MLVKVFGMEAAWIATGYPVGDSRGGNRLIAAQRRQTGHEQLGLELRGNRLADFLARSSARVTSRGTAPARINRSDAACWIRLDQTESKIAPDQWVQGIKRLPAPAAHGFRQDWA